jgi:hypothetical protein
LGVFAGFKWGFVDGGSEEEEEVFGKEKRY